MKQSVDQALDGHIDLSELKDLEPNKQIPEWFWILDDKVKAYMLHKCESRGEKMISFAGRKYIVSESRVLTTEQVQSISIDSDLLETVKADFLDENYLVRPNYRLHRFRGEIERRYFRITDDMQDVIWYLGNTTLLGGIIPESKYLRDWYARHGKEKAEAILAEASAFGTLMHIQAGVFLIKKTWDVDAAQAIVTEYMEDGKLAYNVDAWTNRLRKAMLSFAQFCHDYKVKPIAIELPICSDKWGIATTVDLVCKITILVDGVDPNDPYKTGPRKGQPRDIKVEKEILVLIDLKSGENFYEDHELQLEICERVWRENFSEHIIEEIYNWSPKDWHAKPSYNFQRQTGKHSNEEIEWILSGCELRMERKPAMSIRYVGKIQLGEEPSGNNIQVLEPVEIVRESLVNPLASGAEERSVPIDADIPDGAMKGGL